MKSVLSGKYLDLVALVILGCPFITDAKAMRFRSMSLAESTVEFPSRTSSPELIQPENLADALKSNSAARPLILQIGFRVLYEQAHIPGSEYIGPAARPDGLQQLLKRVASLSRSQYIVLYCGCCPWNDCPNWKPAYEELLKLGFKNVKLLYIAHNLGSDWVEKGYPVERGGNKSDF